MKRDFTFGNVVVLATKLRVAQLDGEMALCTWKLGNGQEGHVAIPRDLLRLCNHKIDARVGDEVETGARLRIEKLEGAMAHCLWMHDDEQKVSVPKVMLIHETITIDPKLYAKPKTNPFKNMR